MKVKDIERVIFTPGLSRESLNCDYYVVDNTVIIGTTGSGKTTTTHAIVKSILDSNEPYAYSLVYMDLASQESNPMCNTNRIIPSMSLMEHMAPNCLPMTYKERAEQMIRHLTTATWWVSRGSGDDEEIYQPEKFLIVVIEGFDMLDKLEQELVFTMMNTCPFVKFIVSAQNPESFKERMDLFTYHIVTRVTSALVSDIVLGCNLGYKKADRYGTIWLYNNNIPSTYRKFRVSYTPTSLMNRFMKVQSGYSGNRNPIVKDITEYFRNSAVVVDFFKKYVGSEDDSFRAYIDKFLIAPREGVYNE